MQSASISSGESSIDGLPSTPVGSERREVDDDEVGFLAGIERSDNFGLAQCAGAAAGSRDRKLRSDAARGKLRFIGAPRLLHIDGARMTCHMFNSGPAATSEPRPTGIPAFMS